MQPMNSAITGALRELERQSSTGPARGETASGSLPSVNENVVRGWLLAQPSVAEADKALLASLRSQHGVEAIFQTESRFPIEGGYYTATVGCSVHPEDAGNLPAAIARMEAASIQPTREQAEDWLILLQAATAGGRKGEIDSAIALEVYSGLLSKYPADVAREACANLALKNRPGGNWFPTLADLNAECEKLSDRRKLVLSAMKTHLARREKP